MVTYFYSAKTGAFYTKGVHKNIPKDCIEVSESQFQKLIEGRAQGKSIVLNGDNDLALMEPDPLDDEQEKTRIKLQKIQRLENIVTPRRIREAILGLDDGWLKNLETEIEKIRQT